MRIPLKDIKPNPANPRLIRDNAFKDLLRSVAQFPQMLDKRPIAVTKEGKAFIALGGNQRTRALTQLQTEINDGTFLNRYETTQEAQNLLIEYFSNGVPAVDCTDLTPDQQRRFIIADNLPFGEWDADALANEWDVDELKEWGMNLPEWGEGDGGEGLEAEEDDYEMPDEIQTDIVLGDLFEIGAHRLLCGDSTDIEQVGRLMDGKKADMVFTDPPYDLKNENYHINISLFSENAHIFIMHDDKGIVNYLRKSNLNFLRFYVANFGFSSPRGNDPYLSHILVSQESNGSAIAHKNMHDGFRSIIPMQYRFRIKDEKTIHKHQKPISFVSTFIEHFSNNNSIVLDLFCGSVTTMVAAHQTKRICYAMELEPKYCQVIIDRMLKLDTSLEIKKNGQTYETAVKQP